MSTCGTHSGPLLCLSRFPCGRSSGTRGRGVEALAHDGNWRGRQIIPAAWGLEATTATWWEDRMVKTHGLTHIHLVVRDLERSLRFYRDVFGMEERFRDGPHMVFLNTPGSRDLITLNQDPQEVDLAGNRGGIAHFGFRLANALCCVLRPVSGRRGPSARRFGTQPTQQAWPDAPGLCGRRNSGEMETVLQRDRRGVAESGRPDSFSRRN